MKSASTLTSAHLVALQEAFATASSLVPPALRPDFVLVGSGAMVYHGSMRPPKDLDIVGTVAAHWAFLEAARQDGRFSVMLDGAFIQYISCSGAGATLVVSIDLIELGGEACPALKYAPLNFGGAFVASMPELWRMKARAFAVTRPDEKPDDLRDFEWLTQKMTDDAIEYDPVELLEMILDELRERAST